MNAEDYLKQVAQRGVDTGRNRFPANIEEARRKAEVNKLLSEIKSDLKIKSVYYPGCGQDSTLEPVFTGRITYLDRSIQRVDAGRHGLVGDFLTPPPEIADYSFDAAFVKDLHLHLDEDGNNISPQEKLSAIIKKVKIGGSLIYQIRRACNKWEGELSFLESQKGAIAPIQLGYRDPDFRVFRLESTA